MEASWDQILDSYEALIERVEHQLDGETLNGLGDLELSSPPLPQPSDEQLARYRELAQRAADVESETRDVMTAIADELGTSKRKRSVALDYARHAGRVEA